MNILFTVGTSSFPELEIAAVELAKICDFQIDLQTPASAKSSSLANMRSFDYYYDDPIKFFQKYDYVVCHAGTGTIFNLLKAQTKFCVIPNAGRHDLHQQEICEWLTSHQYAAVIHHPERVTQFVFEGEFKKFKNKPYRPSEFDLDKLLLFL
ncbi:hypothetical protein N8315_09545 [Octadecabacter sp.]|nr:hypothetical protein [Octadecabacter sp.]